MPSDLFSRVSDAIYALPIRKLAFWLFVVMILRCGVWSMGSLPEQTMATLVLTENPFGFSDSGYIFWNYLGHALAHLCGIRPENLLAPDGQMLFFDLGVTLLGGFYAVLACIGTLLFCHITITRLPDHAARAALLLYFMMPVSGTMYFWLGMDGLTHLLMVLAFLFPRHAAWGFGIGILLGAQHTEQALAGFGAVLFSLLVSHRRSNAPVAAGLVSREWAFGIVGGILVGKLLLVWWFIENNIHLGADRLTFFQLHAKRIIGYFIANPHLCIASVFGAAWLAVLRVVEFKGWRLAFFLPLTGLVLLMLTAEDETRVAALVTFPLIVTWILLNPVFLERLERPFIGMLALLFVIVPWVWLWRGEARPSVVHYDILYITGNLFGWPSLPLDLFKWVFPYSNAPADLQAGV